MKWISKQTCLELILKKKSENQVSNCRFLRILCKKLDSFLFIKIANFNPINHICSVELSGYAMHKGKKMCKFSVYIRSQKQALLEFWLMTQFRRTFDFHLLSDAFFFKGNSYVFGLIFLVLLELNLNRFFRFFSQRK